VQFVKLLFVLSSPFPSYIVTLRPDYLCLHNILKHPQPAPPTLSETNFRTRIKTEDIIIVLSAPLHEMELSVCLSVTLPTLKVGFVSQSV